MKKIAPYWKAVIGFIAPGAVIIGSAVLEVSDGGTKITQAEVVTALVAMVVTGGGVFTKGNKDTDGSHQDESVQPPEDDEPLPDDEDDDPIYRDPAMRRLQ